MTSDPMPEGTHAIVGEAIEEAAQTLFAAADVPLARKDELLAAIQGPALRSVIEARIEQIVKRGHTAETDAMLPIGWLPKKAYEYAVHSVDLINATAERRDLPRARRMLAQVAALAMAGIDRLDAILGTEVGS